MYIWKLLWIVLAQNKMNLKYCFVFLVISGICLCDGRKISQQGGEDSDSGTEGDTGNSFFKEIIQ